MHGGDGVTDLATGPHAQNDTAADDTDAGSGDGTTSVYAWAPEEPKPRKRHLGLWIGVPSGVLAVAAVTASLVLIAPGTAVAGVPIGGMTVGGAADALSSRLAGATVVLNTPDGDVTVTGAELGASIDARTIAEQAFDAHPLWNVTQWNSEPLVADVTLDPAVATDALREAAPGAFTDPTDATVTFDAATASYVSTPATAGEGIDLDQVRTALAEAFSSGADRVTIDASIVPVDAAITTADAETSVTRLNGILDTIGFYVGDERTVPVDRALAASWLKVGTDDGKLTLSADADAIQKTVDTLAPLVDRAPVDATVVTNAAGDVLRDLTPGAVGRTLGDTSQVADGFAAQLAAGDAAYQLPVTEAPFTTTALHRYSDVNLSTQRATFYENGQVVNSWPISSGLGANATPTGEFTVFAHVRMQDMGCTPTSTYCTKDVPWVTYFAPDIGFHGTYWHNNFGSPMSHGCINMPIDQAAWAYEFLSKGSEVSVHY
ncbi:lipoprotein-anchoring transpeptidase ErfK/SrfK [Microbacterium sp. SORGH_AS428]|nr:lipoprotein-anchoring transpeptidase ErfK/SrfK [Microbacterium sp. SORGH_AS_0428]